MVTWADLYGKKHSHFCHSLFQISDPDDDPARAHQHYFSQGHCLRKLDAFKPSFLYFRRNRLKVGEIYGKEIKFPVDIATKAMI